MMPCNTRRPEPLQKRRLNAFIWNWGSSLSDVKEMLEILGPEFVAVTPSQLNDLYRQAQGK